MGVACHCNGEKEFECLIILGKNAKIKGKVPDKLNWPNIMTKAEC